MYNVRKGWPSNAAIDEVLKETTPNTITDGMIVAITGGQCAPANFTAAEAATDPIPGFIIGLEKVKGLLTALLHQCVIEVDAEHYAAATYAAGDVLTAKDGKFAKVTGTGEKPVGKVLDMNATSGLMRVLWYPAR